MASYSPQYAFSPGLTSQQTPSGRVPPGQSLTFLPGSFTPTQTGHTGNTAGTAPGCGSLSLTSPPGPGITFGSSGPGSAPGVGSVAVAVNVGSVGSLARSGSGSGTGTGTGRAGSRDFRPPTGLTGTSGCRSKHNLSRAGDRGRRKTRLDLLGTGEVWFVQGGQRVRAHDVATFRGYERVALPSNVLVFEAVSSPAADA